MQESCHRTQLHRAQSSTQWPMQDIWKRSEPGREIRRARKPSWADSWKPTQEAGLMCGVTFQLIPGIATSRQASTVSWTIRPGLSWELLYLVFAQPRKGTWALQKLRLTVIIQIHVKTGWDGWGQWCRWSLVYLKDSLFDHRATWNRI